jgi:hypothetical protein
VEKLSLKHDGKNHESWQGNFNEKKKILVI